MGTSTSLSMLQRISGILLNWFNKLAPTSRTSQIQSPNSSRWTLTPSKLSHLRSANWTIRLSRIERRAASVAITLKPIMSMKNSLSRSRRNLLMVSRQSRCNRLARVAPSYTPSRSSRRLLYASWRMRGSRTQLKPSAKISMRHVSGREIPPSSRMIVPHPICLTCLREFSWSPVISWSTRAIQRYITLQVAICSSRITKTMTVS